jgi:hypothetical protein
MSPYPNEICAILLFFRILPPLLPHPPSIQTFFIQIQFSTSYYLSFRAAAGQIKALGSLAAGGFIKLGISKRVYRLDLNRVLVQTTRRSIAEAIGMITVI